MLVQALATPPFWPETVMNTAVQQLNEIDELGELANQIQGLGARVRNCTRKILAVCHTVPSRKRTRMA